MRNTSGKAMSCGSSTSCCEQQSGFYFGLQGRIKKLNVWKSSIVEQIEVHMGVILSSSLKVD